MCGRPCVRHLHGYLMERGLYLSILQIRTLRLREIKNLPRPFTDQPDVNRQDSWCPVQLTSLARSLLALAARKAKESRRSSNPFAF